MPRLSPSGVLILLALMLLAATRGLLHAAQFAGAIGAALLTPLNGRAVRGPRREAPSPR